MNKLFKRKAAAYTVTLHQGHDEKNKYILPGVKGEDATAAAESAKRFVAENGYFGSLTANKDYDKIMELLVVDSIEKED